VGCNAPRPGTAAASVEAIPAVRSLATEPGSSDGPKLARLGLEVIMRIAVFLVFGSFVGGRVASVLGVARRRHAGA
jgi:hypothetical protein